jgi:serpin B
VTHSGPTIDIGQLTRALNTFGFEVYHQLPREGNCFFSPLSIAMVLGALVAGARGDTREELERALGTLDLGTSLPERFSTLLKGLHQRHGLTHAWDQEHGDVRRVEKDLFLLRLANGLFVQTGYPLRAAYHELLRGSFHADLAAVDFARPEEAASRINSWVSNRTDERINQIVWRGSITPITRLVLANAVYFLAEWADQFSKEETRRERFYLTESAETSCEVPMMHLTTGFRHVVDVDRGFEAICIPYCAMSMLVVLPERGRLADVHQAVDAALVEDIVARARRRQIALGLPRFQVETGYALRKVFEKLGVRTALDADRADFGGITDEPAGLFLSEVLHRARIRVDEYGTEAAAATVGIVSREMAPRSGEGPDPFIVDRPFLFVVRDDETNAVLFVGRVTDPLE